VLIPQIWLQRQLLQFLNCKSGRQTSYFRRSALRTKLLQEIIPDARAFPKHHDVRFAQHQVQLIDAVLHNMNGCKQVWQSLSTNGDRKDKAEACGFLKTRSEKQVWMTIVMGDVLEIYQTLQQRCQRCSNLYNFLAERLEPDQHDVITKMKKMLSVTSLNEFVESGLDICKHVFPGGEGACEQWDSLSCVPHLPIHT